MITTIQLNESVKKTLNMLKNGKETYEDVIVNLIDKVDADRKKWRGY